MDAAQLLTEVRHLREQHPEGRDGRSPFNIFTTLRSSSDEVNLHSRFLHALLNHREPGGERANLVDFLTAVARVDGFPSQLASVGREIDNIDLLIESHDKKQAIVIENKIWAGDQEHQLRRYWKKLRSRGYPCGGIHLLYLTPFGDPPSAQSVGNLKCTRLSYRDNLPCWLKRCQQRASNEPALLEAIAQYLDLIRNLTNSHPHMTDLKKLCLNDDNLLHAQDLSKAMVEAKVDLIVAFWSTIDKALRASTMDRPLERDPKWAHLTDHEAVQKYVERRPSSNTGLFYWIAEHAWLAVWGRWDGLAFGVSCDKNDCPDLYDRLRDALSKEHGGQDRWAPWHCYPDHTGCTFSDQATKVDFRNLDSKSLALLKSKKNRCQFAQAISVPIERVWREINRAGLIQTCPG